jgi:hypothetical protein
VGASAQEIGCDQDGRTAIGKSSPLTIQTGYSSELPMKPAVRKRISTIESANPSTPSEAIVTGTATKKASGCSSGSGIP